MSNYLDEDPTIKDQKYVCLSFFKDPKGTLSAVKVRGCYETHEKACERCKTLQQIDKDFDIFVGEVGKWLQFNPDSFSVENQEFSDEKFNDIMKGYREDLKASREKSKAEIDKRVKDDKKEEYIRSKINKLMSETNESPMSNASNGSK